MSFTCCLSFSWTCFVFSQSLSILSTSLRFFYAWFFSSMFFTVSMLQIPLLTCTTFMLWSLLLLLLLSLLLSLCSATLEGLDEKECLEVIEELINRQVSSSELIVGPHAQSLLTGFVLVSFCPFVHRCITLQAGTSCKASTWLRSKISRDIWQISCMIWNRARWKFWKRLDAASRFWELLFRFSGEPAKCGRNGPSIHLRSRYSCSTDAKVLPARSSFEWAGEPTIWWQNDRARNTAWDSEIESLTSLNPSLIELDHRKTRRRHRVTAALAPKKSCFLPCK